MSQEQFISPQNFWRKPKQIDPIPPLPEIGPQNPYDLIRQAIIANEDTGEIPVIKNTGPIKIKVQPYTTYQGVLEMDACDIIICAIYRNIRKTQSHPKRIFVCQLFYDKIIADFPMVFLEPFEGWFPTHGMIESIPVTLDAQLHIELPFGKVLCMN